LVDSDEICDCAVAGWLLRNTPRHGKSTSSFAFHSNVTAERHKTRLVSGPKFGRHERWKKASRVDEKGQQLLMEEILRSPVEVGSFFPLFTRLLSILGGAGFLPSTLSLT